jgi:hypothetical protein
MTQVVRLTLTGGAVGLLYGILIGCVQNGSLSLHFSWTAIAFGMTCGLFFALFHRR